MQIGRKFVNIASRCASFINKYFAGQLLHIVLNRNFIMNYATAGDDIADKYNELEYSQAIRQIMALADRANQYIDEKKPWSLIKDQSVEQQQNVQAICSMALIYSVYS